MQRLYGEKNKIIKFLSCYHGHSDAMMVSAGSVCDSGVRRKDPKRLTEDTMLVAYNDLGQCGDSFSAGRWPGGSSGSLEAVGANMGVVPPREGFLGTLRSL